jgi:hypothetical protein
MNILFVESFCPQKTHNSTLLFGSTILKHDRRFYYWNQPLKMRMCVLYLDCHQAGLCCYLVIHIESLLRPLQLFYFHLWPIYWLCVVVTVNHYEMCWCTIVSWPGQRLMCSPQRRKWFWSPSSLLFSRYPG